MKKSVMVKTDLDKQIVELVKKSDHKILAVWACDCAQRVLKYFKKKRPKDNRPKLAIKAGRTWAKTGIFKMADVRETSLAAHAAAREIEDFNPARSAARSAGQAMAVAHVPDHAVAAAIYAATAVRDATVKNVEAAVLKERNWQYQHLLDLNKK